MKDLIIVGGGPAGITAGIYAARNGLDVLIICKDLGGYLNEIDKIENYPGFSSITGFELSEKFCEQIKMYNIEIKEDIVVKKISQENSQIIVQTELNEKIYGKTAIIATGTKKRKLGIPNEDELVNKGVSYCYICDGPVFQNQEIVVVGGGNAGAKAALFLSKIAKKVYILEKENKIFAEKISLDKLNSLDNVKIILNANPKKIIGDEEVKGIEYSENDSIKILNLQGIFIEAGTIPNSDIIDVDKNEKNEIIVNDKMLTSKSRIFAIGDVNNKGPNQVVVAVAQGCIAGIEIIKLLSK